MTVKQDVTGYVRPVKPNRLRHSERIDGIVAAVMGTAGPWCIVESNGSASTTRSRSATLGRQWTPSFSSARDSAGERPLLTACRFTAKCITSGCSRLAAVTNMRLDAWFAPVPNDSLITSRSVGTGEIYTLRLGSAMGF
jgi:hypothetical protein